MNEQKASFVKTGNFTASERLCSTPQPHYVLLFWKPRKVVSCNFGSWRCVLNTWLPNSFSLVASFFLFSSWTSVVLITDLFSTVRHPAVNWSKRCKSFHCLTLINLRPLSLVCLHFALGLQKFVDPILGFGSLQKAIRNAWIQHPPLCHLWTWAGQACCSHPQSFPETFQPPLPPWCMLNILDFCLPQKSLTFFPSEDGCFPRASAQSGLDPSLVDSFWHLLTPSSSY